MIDRLRRLSPEVERLAPGAFSFVMATGIVSSSVRLHHLNAIADALVAIALLGWFVLCATNLARWMVFRHAVLADLRDPTRAFGFFTFVAGTNVLGADLVADGHVAVGSVALVIGTLSWICLGYLIPWTCVVGNRERPLLVRLNGLWFLWVVACQSVAVLASLLAVQIDGRQDGLAFLGAVAWATGLVSYEAIAILTALRLIQYPVSPADLTPPYWISTGATAITVLAGAHLADVTAPMTNALHALIVGLSLVAWSFGTWIIPALLLTGWWRHIRAAIPLRYDVSYWSIVFPLGMYSVASDRIGVVAHVEVIRWIGYHATWIALAAWTVTLGGLCARMGQLLLRR